jgi:hypothetical protein
MTYVVGNDAFVGDTLFMPDYGSARCDFPGGDAATLYRSIHKVLALPRRLASTCATTTRPPTEPRSGSPPWPSSAPATSTSMTASARPTSWPCARPDKTLAMPTLLLPSVQVNVRAGRLPEPEGNGTRYLKLPLDLL